MTGLCFARSLTARLLVAAVLIALANAIGAGGAFAKSRNCTADERRAADRQLWLNAHDKALSLKTHLPEGVSSNFLDFIKNKQEKEIINDLVEELVKQKIQMQKMQDIIDKLEKLNDKR